MKGLKIIGLIVVALVVVGVLVGGYLGYVPGVSNIFGSNKSRDLGVTYTAADYQSARSKVGGTITDLPKDAPPLQSIRYSGSHPASFNLTQGEINALLNNRPWKDYPLKDCQLKINPDGSGEFSAILITGRLKNYALASGVSGDTVKFMDDYLFSKLPPDPPIYARGKLEITNGQIVTSDFKEVQIGRVSIPSEQLQSNKNSIVAFAQQQIRAVPGFSIKTFRMANGQWQFEGTLPDSVARSRS